MTTFNNNYNAIQYPAHLKSNTARKKHKDKVLRDNLHQLYADYAQINGKKTLNNLIFQTVNVSLWRSCLYAHFPHVVREGIGRGGRLICCQDHTLDTEDPVLTITYYTKGTVLIQGNEEHLISFSKDFPALRCNVEKQNYVATSVLNSVEEEEEEETDLCPHMPASPLLPFNRKLAESLANLESDYTQFKEYIHSNMGDDGTIQQLRDEIQKLKRESSNTITELRQILKQVQEENHSLRAQIAKMKDDNTNRDRAFSLQLQELQHQTSNRLPPLPSTAEVPPPSSQPPSQPTSASPPSPPPAPALDREEGRQRIAILMDSNRRFLDTQRLFPKHRVTMRACSTTEHAQQLLKREVIGDPQCIIIHTGTNDLHSLKGGTAGAMKRMAERASVDFPSSRIVISTLLPRHDTALHIINGINAEVSRKCATLSNVHLAHNPFISLRDMYDGIHLHENGVRLLAKALKDAALGRNHTTANTHSTFPPRPHPNPQPAPMPSPMPRPTPRPTTHPTLRPMPCPPPRPMPCPPPHPMPCPRPLHTPGITHCPPTRPQQNIAWASSPPMELQPSPSVHQGHSPPANVRVQPHNYAAAAAAAQQADPTPPSPEAQPGPPEKSELGEIKEMLHFLCRTLLTQ